MDKSFFKKSIPALIYYPVTILFFELFLKFFDHVNAPWTYSILPTVLFSLGTGFLLAFLFLFIRPVILSRILSGITVIALWLFFCIEFDINAFYNMYYGILYAFSMTGQVMGDFSSVVYASALKYAPYEIALAVPVVLYFVFMKRIIPSRAEAGKRFPGVLFLLIPALVLLLSSDLVSRFGPDRDFYTCDFSAQAAVPSFGLLNTSRLEITYALFGIPKRKEENKKYALWKEEEAGQKEAEADGPNAEETNPGKQGEGGKTGEINSGKAEGEGKQGEPDSGKPGEGDNKTEEEPKEIVYGYNAAVDFASLIEEETNPAIKSMHEYFGSLEPTKKNEYTGIFEGKNLIFITAEAFSPYAIDKEYTPTLWKLANNGFVFTDYYQPNWSLSTTGGEFANMTGLLPLWMNSSNSFLVSAGDDMPYAPGNMFARAGYVCRAFHNNSYTYYERHRTHPNLGYDYQGIGNGLVLPSSTWPNSDYEMLQVTIDEMVKDYHLNHIPFHAYYMTVSGHCPYSFGGNNMSGKNKESALEAFPDASMTVQGYMACNKELDLGLEYTLKKLDEAGILEDTVICLSADHYPYSMSQGGTDYYKELSGIDDTVKDITRYKNTLILYCASMEEPVIVDTPCSSIDIVPTLNNLFGLEYDSRLYSGRDIMAVNYEVTKASETMPLVILPVSGTSGCSFITAAGRYDYTKREFIPNKGVTVSDDYVSEVNAIIADKWKYARQIIDLNYYHYVFKDE